MDLKIKEKITTRDLYIKEIANVANNRYLTNAEKNVKIRELEAHVLRLKNNNNI